MDINDELMEHLENLSKLKLEESEIEKMKIDMNEILQYMKLLDESNVEGYEPMFTPIEGHMTPRKDEPCQQNASKLLKIMPHLKNDFLVIPSIYAK